MSELREFIFKIAEKLSQEEIPQLEDEIQFLEMELKNKKQELREKEQLLKEICEEYDFEIRKPETPIFILTDKKGQCE